MENIVEKNNKPHASVMEYINEVEQQYYNDKVFGQSLESKLTTMYALYKSAWAVGEITWDEMFYAYADFVAKLLHIR